MAIATQVRKHFEAGFGAVWTWLDAEIPEWRTRKVIPALDAVLVLADETIPTDADAARSAAERVIGYIEAEESTPVGRPRRRGRSGSYVELRQQARGVLASSMIVQKVTSQPFKLLDTTIRATETTEIKASLLTRRSHGRLEVAEWNGALEDAQAAVELANTSSYKVWKATPHRSRQAALTQLSLVHSVLYDRALLPESILGTVLENSRKALKLKPRMKTIHLIAISAITWASAQLAFTGADVELAPYEELGLPEPAKSSVRWAQARWTEGLYRCACADWLTEEAKACFEVAREDRYRRAVADDVVALTVDLQWWLLRERRFQEAHLESEWVHQHLETCTYDKAVLRRWMSEIETRYVAVETVQAVFREVRKVANVGQPVLAG